MRKLSTVLFSCVLFATMAMAQTNGSRPAQSNSQNNVQTPMTAPPSAQDNRNASQVDRGVPANQNSPKQAQAPNPGQPANTPPQTPGATPNATQRTAHSGTGVPWGWIIVGIIVIAIILALIGRGGTERVVERRETLDRDRNLGPRAVPPERRDDDDIRRVG